MGGVYAGRQGRKAAVVGLDLVEGGSALARGRVVPGRDAAARAMEQAHKALRPGAEFAVDLANGKSLLPIGCHAARHRWRWGGCARRRGRRAARLWGRRRWRLAGFDDYRRRGYKLKHHRLDIDAMGRRPWGIHWKLPDAVHERR